MSSTPPTQQPPDTRDAGTARARLDVELILAFLNTRDVETDTDALDEQRTWEQWCAQWELAPAPDTTEARPIRDNMRAALAGEAHTEATSWPLRVELRSGVPTLDSADALGTILASATRVVHTGHWGRLKICPAHDCLVVFYDRSRNRSRNWCDMKICGNREKARSWRQRRT